MKALYIFPAIYLIALTTFSQQAAAENDQILVSVKNSDKQIKLNVVDLNGTWMNVASTRPIVGSNVSQSYVELTMGHRVNIRDAWTEDYAGRVKNCTWTVVDQSLQFYSPDLGKVEINIEKLEYGNYYEFTLNNVTYRKLVNTSRNKHSRKNL